MTTLERLQGLDEHLARWIADGVVTPDQAEQIRMEERQILSPDASRGTPLVTEALGYVGGVLVVVASLLLAARVWNDLSVGARLGLVGAGAVLLVAVGALLPAPPGTAGERLRSAVWVLSTAAATFFVGLLGYEVLDLRGPDLVLLVTAGAAVHAGVLWRVSRAFAQQLACYAALAGTAAALLAEVAPSGQSGDAMPGLGILGVGAAWLLFTARGQLRPERLSLVLGGVGVVLGSMIIQQAGWGRFVGLAAVAGLVGLALRLGDLALLGVGTLGIFMILPAVMMEWFPGAVAAPLALLLCGALLVLVALRALRSRQRG